MHKNNWSTAGAAPPSSSHHHLISLPIRGWREPICGEGKGRIASGVLTSSPIYPLGWVLISPTQSTSHHPRRSPLLPKPKYI